MNHKKQKIVIVRASSHIDKIVDEYYEKGWFVKQISFSDSFGNWGIGILFEES